MTVLTTKPGLDGLASHWVRDVEFESVIAVGASVFALKITHAQLAVLCLYTKAVFGNEGST